MKMKENSKKEQILEVDLEYPEDLHEEHYSYPLAPGKTVIGKKMMSGHQRHLMEDLNLDRSNC